MATGEIELVSVDRFGRAMRDRTRVGGLSDDARFVLFSTREYDGSSGQIYTVHLRDRLNGTTVLLSHGDDSRARGDSEAAGITPDGAFVLFGSEDAALVPDDANASDDVFVYSRVDQTRERVSVADDGSEANGESLPGDISADGRFVAFSSQATNLAAGDTNGLEDVFVRDRQLGRTVLVSVAADGGPADGASGRARLSADGRFVAFVSEATNLVAGDTNGVADVFVRDLLTGQTQRISVASDGTQGDLASSSADISDDGQIVAFTSAATTLTGVEPASGSRNQRLYTHDRATGHTTAAITAVDGRPGEPVVHHDYGPLDLSGDGRWVTVRTDARSHLQNTRTSGGVLLVDRLANRRPTIEPASHAIFSAAAPGSEVAAMIAAAGEADQTLRYSLADGGASLFEIGPGDGVIRVADGAELAPGTYDLIVTATDDGELARSATAAVRIDVADARPRIDRVSPTVRYVENRSPNYFARAARVVDANTSDFGGAVLSIAVDGGLAEDVVGLRDGGGVISGTDTFGAGGGVVRVATSGVGVFDIADASYAGSSLTITFREGATAADVTRVLRRAAYGNASELPDTGPRTVRVSLTDPAGNVSAAGFGTEAAIEVVSVADPSVLSGFDAAPVWTEGAGPIRFGDAIAVADADTSDFGGSRLDVYGRTPRDAGDRLLLDLAADPGATVSTAAPGGTLRLDGPDKAILARGLSANRLILDLLPGTDAADVARIARLIAFDSDADAPRGPKQVRFGLIGADRARGAAIVSLTVVPTNDAPAILNVEGTVRTVAAGGGPVRLASGFAISDPDYRGGGGTLQVSVAEPPPGGLAIATDPASRVSVAGDAVLFDGVSVATLTGLGTGSLGITFGSAASVASVRSIGRLIAFDAAANAAAASHAVTWSFADESGAMAPAATMTLAIDAPPPSSDADLAQASLSDEEEAVRLLDDWMSEMRIR